MRGFSLFVLSAWVLMFYKETMLNGATLFLNDLADSVSCRKWIYSRTVLHIE